ncbi:MAG: DUF262 domain-containing protein [Candidatus Electrothrix sp. AU1_5]|nr:DUF262 domain-containing protein [Candidatus Electrothrix gigas]
MAKKKFSIEQQEMIIQKVKEKSIPYDYRTKDYPFEVICKKYGDQGDLEATLYVPEYQRNFVWKPDRQSKFIESVLLGVPLTPFLVSEDNEGRLEIIDGSQRIRTLIAFYEDKLILRKLLVLKKVNSAKFKDLPRKLQNYIKNRDFKFIVVSDKADSSIRKDIFERINTSEKLKDSEIRKGSYSGPFYDLVLGLKDHATFRTVCPVSAVKEERGEYEELILRFLAYIDRYKEVKHDVAVFLNSYLDDMNNTEFDKDVYLEKFNNMIDFISKNFPIGFRKKENSGSTPRVRFEAIAVGVHLALQEKNDLTPYDMSWLNSKEFADKTTSDASNNPGRLKNRVEFVRDCLLGNITKDQLTYEQH